MRKIFIRIECISYKEVQLIDYIQYPSVVSPEIGKLWDESPNKFDFSQYCYDDRENPSFLVSHLSKIFREKYNWIIKGPVCWNGKKEIERNT